MRFTLLVSSAFAALAVATPVAGTSKKVASTDLSSTVVSQVATLQADCITLNKTLNTFKPDQLLGVATALTIQNQAGAISTDLTNLATTTNKSSIWNQTESFTVAFAIIDFEPIVFSLLNNIVVKKPAFASAVLLVGDLTLTVQNLLVQQRELSREFGNAVATKLDPSLASYAPAITKQILDKFDTTIAAYKACSGVLCLPPL